ncbi:MAG: GTPase Era [Leptolyngbya foveolarum]|uniref:GTPase Era n=1 Tax=Leptolyngbya foveolarum TaxID=47253 RepID=A0A2W4UG76_9CYAN|nr:MAG: GTPase Era [Leptolyngbya foveolarum]
MSQNKDRGDSQNPWRQAAGGANNKPVNKGHKKKSYTDKSGPKKGGYQGADNHSEKRSIPRYKGVKNKPIVTPKPLLKGENGPVLKSDTKLKSDKAQPEKSQPAQDRPSDYPIVPLDNPAAENIEIKGKPNISQGLIPTAAPDFRSGFISIVGRPNVGKSTLMNLLVGQKIAITSPIAQTTRNRLQGIVTTPQAQMIFVDTPGIHKPHHELGKVLVQNARIAINSVDVVLFVVEATALAGKGDLFVADLVARTNGPVVLGINKIDALSESGRKAAAVKDSYESLAAEHGWTVVRFSALTGEGIDTLQEKLIEHLEPGPYYYPPDLVTDQPERFIMGELLREQVLLHTREEVPHSVAIAIDKVEEDEKITRILATVNVERKSQKGILIGKGGAMMKAISSAARQQMQKLVAGQVYLEVFVRVQERWRQSRTHLSEFGYKIDQ